MKLFYLYTILFLGSLEHSQSTRTGPSNLQSIARKELPDIDANASKVKTNGKTVTRNELPDIDANSPKVKTNGKTVLFRDLEPHEQRAVAVGIDNHRKLNYQYGVAPKHLAVVTHKDNKHAFVGMTSSDEFELRRRAAMDNEYKENDPRILKMKKKMDERRAGITRGSGKRRGATGYNYVSSTLKQAGSKWWPNDSGPVKNSEEYGGGCRWASTCAENDATNHAAKFNKLPRGQRLDEGHGMAVITTFKGDKIRLSTFCDNCKARHANSYPNSPNAAGLNDKEVVFKENEIKQALKGTKVHSSVNQRYEETKAMFPRNFNTNQHRRNRKNNPNFYKSKRFGHMTTDLDDDDTSMTSRRNGRNRSSTAINRRLDKRGRGKMNNNNRPTYTVPRKNGLGHQFQNRRNGGHRRGLNNNRRGNQFQNQRNGGNRGRLNNNRNRIM